MRFRDFEPYVVGLTAVFAAIGLSGCSGPFGVSSSDAPPDTDLSRAQFVVEGTATLGAIQNGEVYVYSMGSGALLGQARTNASGRYAVGLSQIPSGLLKIVVNGGTYVHEATHRSVRNDSISALAMAPTAGASRMAVHVSAASAVAVEVYQSLPAGDPAALYASANQMVSTQLGFDFTTVSPTDGRYVAFHHAAAVASESQFGDFTPWLAYAANLVILGPSEERPSFGRILLQAFQSIPVPPVGASPVFLAAGPPADPPAPPPADPPPPPPPPRLPPAPPLPLAPPPHSTEYACYRCGKANPIFAYFYVWAPVDLRQPDLSLNYGGENYTGCATHFLPANVPNNKEAREAACKAAQDNHEVCCHTTAPPPEKNELKGQLACQNAGGVPVDPESVGCRKGRSCYECKNRMGYYEHFWATGTLIPRSGGKYAVVTDDGQPVTDCTWKTSIANKEACVALHADWPVCCAVADDEAGLKVARKLNRAECSAQSGTIVGWNNCESSCFRCIRNGYPAYVTGRGRFGIGPGDPLPVIRPQNPPVTIDFDQKTPPVDPTSCQLVPGVSKFACDQRQAHQSTICCYKRSIYGEVIKEEMTEERCLHWHGQTAQFVDRSVCQGAANRDGAAR